MPGGYNPQGVWGIWAQGCQPHTKHVKQQLFWWKLVWNAVGYISKLVLWVRIKFYLRKCFPWAVGIIEAVKPKNRGGKRKYNCTKLRQLFFLKISISQTLTLVYDPLLFAHGFWNPSHNVYLKDGVHLNVLGSITLYRSYRGAVLKSLSLPLMVPNEGTLIQKILK